MPQFILQCKIYLYQYFCNCLQNFEDTNGAFMKILIKKTKNFPIILNRWTNIFLKETCSQSTSITTTNVCTPGFR